MAFGRKEFSGSRRAEGGWGGRGKEIHLTTATEVLSRDVRVSMSGKNIFGIYATDTLADEILATCALSEKFMIFLTTGAPQEL